MVSLHTDYCQISVTQNTRKRKQKEKIRKWLEAEQASGYRQESGWGKLGKGESREKYICDEGAIQHAELSRFEIWKGLAKVNQNCKVERWGIWRREKVGNTQVTKQQCYDITFKT